MTTLEMWDYSLMIANSLRRKGRLPSTVEVVDAASAGLIAGIRAMDRLDAAKGASIKTFVTNRMHGAIRYEIDRQMRNRDRNVSYESLEDIKNEPSSDPGPEMVAIATEQLLRLNREINSLPGELKAVLRERFMEGAPMKTIAERRSYSEARASQVVKRAVEMLRSRVVD